MSGFQVKYKELFSVSVLQPFYTNGVCKQYYMEPVTDFDIVPTAECLDLLARMDMVFRKVDNKGGCTVLARVRGTNGSGDDLLRFPAQSGDKLTFLMVLKNPAILNINDLPTQFSSSQLFYFSNESSDGMAARNNLHLSQDPAGVKTANDVIKKAAGVYRFHKAAVVAAGSAVVVHQMTGRRLLPDSIVVNGAESDLQFDLSQLPLGKSVLSIDGIENDTFYNVGAVIPPGLFGIIELSLADSIGTNYRIIEADRSITQARPQFAVPFVSRKTYWRYTLDMQPSSGLYQFIQGLSGTEKTAFFNGINITSNDTNITFQKVVATETQLQFVSATPLSLQESYLSSTGITHDRLSLTLKKYVGDVANEGALKGNLPYPDISTINATNGTVYSDIFITI